MIRESIAQALTQDYETYADEVRFWYARHPAETLEVLISVSHGLNKLYEMTESQLQIAENAIMRGE